MPPKNAKGSDKKAIEKAKKKLEDSTFGLKNKKSKKTQEFVKQKMNQVESLKKPMQDKAEKKKQEQKADSELKALFAPVVHQKVPFGVNPKTVVCEMFKLGTCDRTAQRCKFSHDLSVGRKGTKLDVYTDRREVGEKDTDTIDKWDQSKLEEVVLSKHGNPQTTTTIVCKYFLEAIENGKYGWFWDCPNGGNKCKYKHALPPGFVLKKDKKPSENKSEISLEEFLETERHNLGSNLTAVTLESFTKWKQERQLRKEEEDSKARQAKEKAFKAGKLSKMSGRDFFEFNPDLHNDDNDDGDEYDFSQFRNADGGYQHDDDDGDDVGGGYGKGAADQKAANQTGGDQSKAAAGSGTAPQNEALFVAESLEGLGIDGSDDE
ncbi:Translation machinery-associated protein 46 [Coemansia sp. Benny D160-2]|nr:Translation machinery-associated protein 46 [Coemansia sp. Benny D160-2]